MVLAVIVGIAAPDIETHAAHCLQYLGVIAGQITGGRQQIDVRDDVREVVPVESTRERHKMQAAIARGYVEMLDNEVMTRSRGSAVGHDPRASLPMPAARAI